MHTIYPPGAQVLFLVLYVVSPAGAGAAPAQVMGGLFALAVTVLLMVGLRRRGGDPRRAVLWAWCPLVPLEAASNGHIDVAAALLTVLALLVVAKGKRPWLAGALLGLAVVVKVTPLAVLPAVLRRRPWAMLVSLSTVVLVAYLPHLVAVGGGALGYLGGYAREEGYTRGWWFAVAVAVLAGATAWAWRTADPERPWEAAAVTTGGLLLVTAPAYPWYATLLVALVGLGGAGRMAGGGGGRVRRPVRGRARAGGDHRPASRLRARWADRAAWMVAPPQWLVAAPPRWLVAAQTRAA